MSLTRRDLLRNSAAALVAGGFVRLLQPTAQANAANGPRRLLVLYGPNGTVHAHWRPQGNPSAYSFAPTSILGPLEPHRQRLIVLDGLNFHNATNHEGGMAAMLTNQGGLGSETRGASLDQVVGAQIGGGYRLRTFELGVHTSAWGGSNQTRMSYAEAGRFLAPDDDPIRAYTRLYGDVGADATAAARRLARRQSVLDLVKAEIGVLRTGLGAEEQAKLDVHLDSLREVERTLTTPTPCSAPPLPVVGDHRHNDAFADVTRAQLELAVAALSCGATPVASVQLSHTVSPSVFSFLGERANHHELSHMSDGQVDGVASFVNCQRWISSQLAWVLDRLDGLPDPAGGTLLDSTLVLFVSEMGDSRMHTCDGVPWVMTGGGAFTEGRWLQLGGEWHGRVLYAIASAMGVPIASFGDATSGTGRPVML